MRRSVTRYARRMLAPGSIRQPASADGRRRPDPRRHPGRAGGRGLVGRLRPRARQGRPAGWRRRRAPVRHRTRWRRRRLHPGGRGERARVPPRRHRPVPADRPDRSRPRTRRDPDPGRPSHRRARPPPADDRSGRRQQPRDRRLREGRLPSRGTPAPLPADAGRALDRRPAHGAAGRRTGALRPIATHKGLVSARSIVRMGSPVGGGTLPTQSIRGRHPAT